MENKEHEYVMNLLREVPGVKEHLKLINDIVDKFNEEEKQALVFGNAQYLESFRRNGHEAEYQEYTRLMKNSFTEETTRK